jgi:predicted phosphodiesterase
MPTAALADIHGNLHALEAVLADSRLAVADGIVVLGDVVTGTCPAETLDRLLALPEPVLLLRGNADRLALEDRTSGTAGCANGSETNGSRPSGPGRSRSRSTSTDSAPSAAVIRCRMTTNAV